MAQRNTHRLRKDAITTVDVSCWIVAHLTDASVPGQKPVMLNRSDWFSEEAALCHAAEQSKAHPAPQRFAVYDPDWRWLGTYQCGEKLPAFVMV